MALMRMAVALSWVTRLEMRCMAEIATMPTYPPRIFSILSLLASLRLPEAAALV